MQVQVRLYIVDDTLQSIAAWDGELEPMEGGRRSGEEWAREYLQECYDIAGLRELFDLPAEGDYQVVATITLEGHYDSYTMEYDTDLDVLESKHQEIPADYFPTDEEVRLG